MKTFSHLFICLLLLAAAPVPGRSAAPAAPHATEAQDAELPEVTAEFFKLSKRHQPPLSWRKGMSHGTLTVFTGTPETLKSFKPLRAYARKTGNFYIVNVFAKGDKEQRPVYLYLLSKQGDAVGLVAAFHYENGRPRRIKG